MLPTSEELQPSLDYMVIKAMAEHGDPLTPKRDVQHCAYFPTDHAAHQFADAASKQGFKTEVERIEVPDKSNPWCVLASRDDSLTEPSITDVTVPLCKLAESHGGDYDGWEAMLIRPKKGLFKRILGR